MSSRRDMCELRFDRLSGNSALVCARDDRTCKGNRHHAAGALCGIRSKGQSDDQHRDAGAACVGVDAGSKEGGVRGETDVDQPSNLAKSVTAG